MKRVHTTEKSKFIIEKLMIQHFSEIFHKLDSDGDGMISSQKIDLSNLDTSLLGVLEHIFSEMEEMGH
jgi:Ca2+-binding EF-hand superfamily protein